MSKKAQAAQSPLRVVMEAEVARRIRQHGRSSMKAEICGVLIGRESGRTTFVDACIPGENAARGGAHVTFTQETWEHIYQVKDKEFPDERIVGWYHSHPGFGVFLSDHDTFIQQNFFSSPQQIAWVYDPHTDEEGCFGWSSGKIVKVDDVAFRYEAPVGEVRGDDDRAEESDLPATPPPRMKAASPDWMDLVFAAATYLVLFVAGFAVAFFLFPARPQPILFMPDTVGHFHPVEPSVSQDPRTGQVFMRDIKTGEEFEVRPDLLPRMQEVAPATKESPQPSSKPTQKVPDGAKR